MESIAGVDDYISAQPKDVAAKLAQIRQIVREVAPQATEKLSYGIPYYHLNGRLLYFMAHREHIGLYPMASSIEHFKKDLAGYETSKGTVRFPLDKPLPLELIRRIVKFRAQENLGKATKAQSSPSTG